MGFTTCLYSCTDINECTRGTDNCDANAVCTNVAGGFMCACRQGFHGNGVTCSGKQYHNLVLTQLSRLIL